MPGKEEAEARGQEEADNEKEVGGGEEGGMKSNIGDARNNRRGKRIGMLMSRGVEA